VNHWELRLLSFHFCPPPKYSSISSTQNEKNKKKIEKKNRKKNLQEKILKDRKIE